ncbi:hypothetical protein Mapa_007605 [Marchantia paleacea]|nr:hypothetical protein Mapa_007605 [Marchantia paleacea]
MGLTMRTVFTSALWSLVLLSVSVGPAAAHGGNGDGHDDENLDLRAKDLVLVKVYCLIIVFFATFIPGVSPYFFRWNHAFLVLGIQFAGGIFLATAMLHFLSDANETFKDHTSKTYPFAFMLACVGYLVTNFADVIIQFVYARQPVSNHAADIECAPGGKPCKPANWDAKSCCDVGDASHGGEDCECPDEVPYPKDAGVLVKATLIPKVSFGDAVLLVFALCFHSIFEGIAIGVAATTKDAWRSLWTVTLHKVFAAIAMGIALLRIIPDRPLWSCAAYSLAFAISSPIGLAIGILIDQTSQGNTADWIYAISMGFAAGVFIYVAINHLLAKGYTPPCKIGVDQPFYKFFFVTLGVAVMSVVMIWD